MPTNDFLPFGTADGANVLAQSDYSSLAARTAGFASGIARSAQMNKVWRQSSFFSAGMSKWMADNSGLDMLDDGDLTAHVGRIDNALSKLLGTALQTITASTATLVAGARRMVLVNAGSNSVTITLPAANALGGRPIQYNFIRTDSSANTVTVQRAGSDTIEGSSSSSITLAVGERLLMQSDGASVWYFPAGRSQWSLAANGWELSPSGRLTQWGIATFNDISGTATVSISFPKTFATVYQVLVTPQVSGGFAISAMVDSSSITTSGFSAVVAEWASVVQSGGKVSWLAIGK